ncbi:MAG: ABC transporter ATP-binding protein [Victivallaceae bacterium]|nr:ABC transporter ATP-binding protein [Victivallaceae bacterium]
MIFGALGGIWAESWRYLRDSFRYGHPAADRVSAAADPRDIRRLLFVQAGKHWGMVVGLIGCLMVAAAVDLLLPLLRQLVIDRVLVPRSTAVLWPLLIAILAVYAVSGGCQSFQIFLSGRLQHRLSLGLKADLTGHLLKLPGEFFDRVPSGYIAGRVMEDVRSMSAFFGVPMQTAVSSFMKLLGALSMLFWFNWRVGLGVFCVIPVFFLAARFFGRRHYALSARNSEETSVVFGNLQETITNIKVVKSVNAERGALDSLSRNYEDIYRLNMEMTALTVLFQRVMRWLPGGCFLAVMLYGCFKVVDGAWSIGELQSVASYVQLALAPTRLLAYSMVQMASANASLGRMSALLGLVPEENLESGVVPERLKGDIEFKNVDFSYLPGQMVLHGLSLTIPAHRTVALVGGSGAGKSTFASLLMHFYKPQSGDIIIDGRPIGEYNLPALRRRIGFLGADAKLFRATLAENLRYGNPEASDADIVGILDAVGLSAFSGNLNVMLEEGANNLSAGQQLRVALARELLRDTDVLILDEPTSALDRESEIAVGEALKRYAGNRTIIIITHREYLAKQADSTAILRDSTVFDCGKYDELCARYGAICASGEK